jgi:sugar/nucleoside kinase (ribokinase family)/fructoselysine-6-P-deglycase FrlB-like protein
MTAPVIIVGNLTIDDVIQPDGSSQMGTLGGNSVHACAAALTWVGGVGIVARCGTDFPAAAIGRLREAGADTGGVRPIDGPTVRNWVIYEADGSRNWVYRTPPGRSAEVAPQPGDIPAAWLGRTPAPVVHVAAMPLAAATAIVRSVRDRARGAAITLDTHEGWRRGTGVLDAARLVDVFLPSREELAELVGHDDPPRAAGELTAAGVKCVVVKMGGDGALVARPGMPLAHAPASQVAVVDPTGAGDSFCGGFAAGLALGEDVVGAARRGCATAAAAIGAAGSLRLLDLGPVARDLLAGGETAATSRVAPGGEATETGSADPGGEAKETGRAGPGVTGGSRPAGPRPAVGVPGNPAAPGAAADRPGQTGTGPPGQDDAYGIEVMHREIATIPDVIAGCLADPGGHVQELAGWLAGRGIEHLYLTGCGDSAFAGLAASLAFRRHSRLRVHPVHALDLARYLVRYLPPASAVLAISFSGSVGRTIEAARQAAAAGHPVIALTGNPEGQLAAAADRILPIDVPTLGFSPGTSTYIGMLCTLIDLALRTSRTGGDGTIRGACDQLPGQAAKTLDWCDAPASGAAARMTSARFVTFLGAGPNEATARFGAAKLFEASQQIAVATNIEEWAHEEYFITRPGDPVVLVAPAGAAHDRAGEILSELQFVRADATVISDTEPPGRAGHLRLAAGAPEELSPVLAALPLAQLGFHLARQTGKRSYNFPSPQARDEHYDTIHRATLGEPA